MLTDKQCKELISKLAWALGVSPKLISLRLLNEQDKNDIRQGVLNYDALKLNIELWRDNGMPDYANGKLEPYEAELKRLKSEKPFKEKEAIGRKPFVEYSTAD